MIFGEESRLCLIPSYIFITSWWFQPPTWTICEPSNFMISPRIGVKIERYLKALDNMYTYICIYIYIYAYRARYRRPTKTETHLTLLQAWKHGSLFDLTPTLQLHAKQLWACSSWTRFHTQQSVSEAPFVQVGNARIYHDIGAPTHPVSALKGPGLDKRLAVDGSVPLNEYQPLKENVTFGMF